MAITVVIPAAGRSVRYSVKGYAVRKPFLTVAKGCGTPMFMLNHVLSYVPEGTPKVVGVPPGYEWWSDLNPSVKTVVIDRTISHVDTVRQLLPHVSEGSGVLLMDADTLIDTIPFLRDDNPDLLVAACRHPSKWQSTVNEACTEFDDPPYSPLPYGVVSLRYFGNLDRLRLSCRDAWSLTEVLQNYSFGAKSRAIRIIDDKDWQDWGTPDNLMKNGAFIA